MRYYQLGFIILFVLLIVFTLIIILGFAGILEGQLTESATICEPDASVELTELLNEDNGNEFNTARNC